MPVQIEYNEVDSDFDKQYYPIEDWHREAVEKLAAFFHVPEKTVWMYQATVHSRIFGFPMEALNFPITRLDVKSLTFLLDIPGFRWVELVNGYMNFSLQHKKPE